MDTESGVQTDKPGFESEVLVGEKRVLLEAVGASESSQKRIKLGDLETVKDQEETGGIEAVHPDVSSVSGALNLNVSAGSIGISAASCFEESNKVLTPEKGAKTQGFAIDLNADDVSSSVNDPFHLYKAYGHLKSRDESECGSSVGSLDEKYSMKVWEGLKQNHCMSAHGVAVPNSIPKARGRKKSNNDMMKRVELAKKEQADRFAKVAAPSGLLNGLNPGIINHVRNSKQVHAIIEALVRSEKTENEQSGSQQGNQTNGTREPSERGGLGDLHNAVVNRSGMSFGNVMLEKGQVGIHVSLAELNYLKSEFTGGYDHSCKGEERFSETTPSPYNFGNKDSGLALRLPSSVTLASENTCSLSNEESGNLTCVVDSLSVKAAKVASQWLGLLNQDIKGRLAALRRSKKRVRTVITKELPSVVSREFSPNSTLCHIDKASVDAHTARWGALFRDMDKALSEEEKHLEAWLKQVNEMQQHCENGLIKSTMHRTLQDTSPLQNNNRSNEANNSEEELAIMAAAASMYSTCSYLSSMGNLPCC